MMAHAVAPIGLPSADGPALQGGGGQHHVPQATWPALARAFEMFLLGASLPSLGMTALGLPPAASPSGSRTPSGGHGHIPTHPHHHSHHHHQQQQHASSPFAALSGGGSAAAAAVSPSPPPWAAAPAPAALLEQRLAGLDVIILVLDCLSETVLSACQYAPPEVRRALVAVIDAAAAAPLQHHEEALPASSRLGHVCLNKLYVLCSRGQDGDAKEQSTRCQLEVGGGWGA